VGGGIMAGCFGIMGPEGGGAMGRTPG